MNAAQRKFIEYVRCLGPKVVEDLRPKYRTRIIGEGAFRRTYDVRQNNKSLGLVIKFPHSFDSIQHSAAELKAIRRIDTNPKLVAIRRYLPDVLYGNFRTGVIVMPRYKRIPWTMRFYGFAQTFECMLCDLIPEMRYEFDSGNANFGLKGKHEEYVVLDLGLIGETR